MTNSLTSVFHDRARLRNRAANPQARRPSLAGRATLTVAALAASMALACGSAQARPAPRSFADLVEKVAPAVVVIRVQRQQSVAGFQFPTPRSPQNRNPGTPGTPRDFDREQGRRFFPNNPNLRRFFERRFRNFRTRGVGSGFIIDAKGYVVTNHHVINRATRIEVVMHDGKVYQAKLIGSDAKTDLAVLKIEAGKPLQTVSWGDSSKARIGDWVMAMGNPFGIGTTVTAGIISARGRNIGGRTIVDYIQVDAAINKGNSGGPTFNLDGEVIGVNTAIYSPNGGSVGVGFAIPSNTARQVIEQLKTRGRVDRGWLGVQIGPVTKQIADAVGLKTTDGAIVAMVVPNSPAAEAGVRTGDVILRWNGQTVKNVRDLVRKVAMTASRTAAKAVVWRNGKEVSLDVRVGDLHKANFNRNTRRSSGQPDTPPAVDQSLEKMGLSVGQITPALRRQFRIGEDTVGVVVMKVLPDSPAGQASLRRGDVITKVGDKTIANADDLRQAIAAARKQGRKGVLVMIRRNGRPAFVGLGL